MPINLIFMRYRLIVKKPNVLFLLIIYEIYSNLKKFILVFLKKILLVMQNASPQGFLKTLLYIFLFYYVFKFLARIFFPIVAKKVVQKAEEKFKEQQEQFNRNNQNNPVNNNQPIKEKKKVGDYIDYEEID